MAGDVEVPTLSHTVASGSNLLMVTVGWKETGQSISSATYGGVALTAVPSSEQDFGTSVNQKSFYLINPSSGTSDIVVDYNGTTAVDTVIIAADFSGVNIDTGLIFDTIALAEANSGATSNTVSPLSNTTIESDIIYAASCVSNNINQAPSNSQTEIADVSGVDIGLVTGYKTALQGVTPIGWTFTNAGYAIHAFAIRPAGIACIAPSADANMRSDAATTNYNTGVYLGVGESNAGASIERTWIKPAFTGIPVDATITASMFRMAATTDLTSNARDMNMHRCLRDVVAAEVTYTRWKVSNNWATLGAGNSTTDYEGAVTIGTLNISATPAIDTFVEMTLTAAEIHKFFIGTYTNNGVTLRMATETNDETRWHSTDAVTSAFHPRFVFQYTVPAANGNFFLFF
jgi:hypothetical protein